MGTLKKELCGATVKFVQFKDQVAVLIPEKNGPGWYAKGSCSAIKLKNRKNKKKKQLPMRLRGPNEGCERGGGGATVEVAIMGTSHEERIKDAPHKAPMEISGGVGNGVPPI